MKAEAWIFAICTVFFLLVAPAYWFIAGDPTGTSALVMTFLLTLLVTLYLGVHASKMEPRPEDRPLELLAEIPQHKPVVLHCKSGVRSAEALAALHKAGFADAVHVGGGVLAWVRQVDPSLPTY